jgi:RNA polymerase sigma-70 factor (ECF subfamily)
MKTIVQAAETLTTAPEDSLDWGQVYWDFLPRIYNFVLYKVGDPTVAEDLTSTTFVEVWRCRQRYVATKGALSTWIFTIAHRVVVHHYRQRRTRELPLFDAAHLPNDIIVAELVEKREAISELVRHLNDLSEGDHDLVALKYGARITNREIAQLLGLSESSVGTRLHRIIGRLRGVLGVHSQLPKAKALGLAPEPEGSTP